MSAPMNPPPLDEEIVAARELLALGPGANRTEIMAAWRIAARMTHPDTVSPDAVDIATRMSQRVNEARDLLLSLLPTVLDDTDDVPDADDPTIGGTRGAAASAGAAAPPTVGQPSTTVSTAGPTDAAAGAATGAATGAVPGSGDDVPAGADRPGAAPPPPPPPPPPSAKAPPIPVDDGPARAPVPGASPGSVFGRPSPSASRPSAPKFSGPTGTADATAAAASSSGAAGGGDVPPPPAQPSPQMPRGLHTVVGGTTEVDSAMSSSAGLPRPRPIRTTTRDGAGSDVAPAGATVGAPTAPATPTAPTAGVAEAAGSADATAATGSPVSGQPQIDPEVLAAAAARRAAPQRPAARPGAEVRRPDRKALAKKRAEEKKAEKARKKPKGVQFDEDGKPILTKGSGLNSTTALLIIVVLLGGGFLAWQYGLLDQYLSSSPDDPVLAAVEAGEVVADPAAPPVAAPDPSAAVGLAVSAVSVGDPSLLAGVVAPDVRQDQLATIVEAFVPAAEDQELPAAVKAQLTCTDPAQPTATCSVPTATGIELAEPIDLVATPQGWRIVGLAPAPAQP